MESFNHPVTIAVRYTDQENGPIIEDSLALYWLSGTDWVTDGINTVVRADNTITSTTEHFTLFAVLGETNRVYMPTAVRVHHALGVR